MKTPPVPAWFREVLRWYRGKPCQAVAGLAKGRLKMRLLACEAIAQIRSWGKARWLVAWGVFCFLALLSCLGTTGAWLWLVFAPGMIGVMLCLFEQQPAVIKKRLLHIILKAGLANYTLLSWIFLNLLLGIFACLLLSGLLYLAVQSLSSKAFGHSSLFILVYAFPLMVLAGVLWKTLRFYLGTYFVLPLVVMDRRSLFPAIRASRSALKGSYLRISSWMLLGWLINCVPLLVFGVGILILFYWGPKILSPSETSLWVGYAYGVGLFLVCSLFALLAWPVGFAMKVVAYRKVFGFPKDIEA